MWEGSNIICRMGFLVARCRMFAVNELCHEIVDVGLSIGDSGR